MYISKKYMLASVCEFIIEILGTLHRALHRSILVIVKTADLDTVEE